MATEGPSKPTIRGEALDELATLLGRWRTPWQSAENVRGVKAPKICPWIPPRVSSRNSPSFLSVIAPNVAAPDTRGTDVNSVPVRGLLGH